MHGSSTAPAAAVVPHRLLNRSHWSCPFMCTSSASYFPHSTTIPASVPKVIYSWQNTLLILMCSKSFCIFSIFLSTADSSTATVFFKILSRNHACIWYQVSDRNHNLCLYLAQITCRDFWGNHHRQSLAFQLESEPHSISAPYNSTANVCIIWDRKCPMGPSASAELACYGVGGRSPLLMVPAPPNAKTCGLGTKGIIQRLEAEHWHLCFIGYLKL